VAARQAAAGADEPVAVLDAMAGCGIRALRFGLEAMPAGSVLWVNDADPDRLPLLEANLAPLRAELARDTTPSPEKLKKIQREQKKIEEVRSRPDFAAQALLQLGTAYLQTRRYDEARLVFRHVARFGGQDLAGPADQQVILTYALQGRTGEADKKLEEYRRKYPDQKGIAGLVDYLVGRALLEDGKTDEAIRRLESAQEKAAGERFADEIPRFIASAYQKAGQGGEALKFYDKFLSEVKAGKRKVSDESYESTQLLYASALITEKKVPEGVAKLKELIASAKTGSIKEDAELRLGYALRTAQQPAEAAEVLAKFIAAYPASDNLANARLARGDALVEAKKIDEAVVSWRDVLAQQKDSPGAVEASERIWRLYQREKKNDLMLAAQEEQLKNFPKEPRNLGVYLARGATFAEARDEAQALAAYRKAFELFLELYPDATTSPPPSQISDLAYSALDRSADLEIARAKSLGTFSNLTEEQKKKWKEFLDQAPEHYSRAVLGYSPARVAPTLSKLVTLALFPFQAGEAPVEDCLKPFRDLAAKASANPGLVAQILFAQASVPFEANQVALALRLYEDAYQKSVETKVALDWRDLERFLPEADVAALRQQPNKPLFLMKRQGQRIYDGMAQGTLQGFDSFQMEGQLAALSLQQAVCERIKTIPIPRQYDYFTRLFVRIFVVLLPFFLIKTLADDGVPWLVMPLTGLIAFLLTAIERTGAVNEEPFENRITDVPLSAACREIERDLRALLGESDLPPKLEPQDGYLF
jgi:tetratricopeptide (TPR) repeat protein